MEYTYVLKVELRLTWVGNGSHLHQIGHEIQESNRSCNPLLLDAPTEIHYFDSRKCSRVQNAILKCAECC